MQEVADVFKYLIAFTLKCQYLTLEGQDTAVLEIVSKLLHCDVASHPTGI
jgi:hypothetical protein